jgi:hypothetical protein
MLSVSKKLLRCCTALLLAFAALGSVPAQGALNSLQVKPEGASAQEARQGKIQFKPISEVRIGDEVLAFAEWKEKGDTLEQDQRLSYEKVLDVIASHREQRLVHITLETGERLTATDGHPFKTAEGWRDAIMLKKGGKLLLKGAGEDDDDAAEYSDGGERTVTIKDIQVEHQTIPVYNLEVANAHTFFVGEDGVLVHNAKIPCELQRAAGARYNEILKQLEEVGKGPVGRSGDNASIKSQAAQRLIEEANKIAGKNRSLAEVYKTYAKRKQAQANAGNHP